MESAAFRRHPLKTRNTPFFFSRSMSSWRHRFRRHALNVPRGSYCQMLGSVSLGLGGVLQDSIDELLAFK